MQPIKNKSKPLKHKITNNTAQLSEDLILTNLKILANINANDKVTINNYNNISIDPPYLSQSLFRWFNGDSRNNTINTIFMFKWLRYKIIRGYLFVVNNISIFNWYNIIRVIYDIWYYFYMLCVIFYVTRSKAF